MARSLNHNLNVFLPGTFGEFAEAHQLFNLADIRCVGKAARTAGVTERNGHIVFTADIENLIVILVERILLAGHAHPGEHEGAAAGNNIHFPFVFADLIDGFSGDAAVQGDEIDTVLGMEADDVNKIFGGQRIQVSLVMDHTVIYWYGADHGRTFGGQFPPERLRIAVARQVHDGFCAHIDRGEYLLHLHIVIFTVFRNTEIYIDFRAQHRADALRIDAGVQLIGRNGNLSAGNERHQVFHGHILFFCDFFQLRCYNAAACGVHLCCVIAFHLLFSFIFKIRSGKRGSAVPSRGRDPSCSRVRPKYTLLRRKWHPEGKAPLRVPMRWRWRVYSRCRVCSDC